MNERKELPEWMRSDKKGDPLRHAIIPLEEPETYLDVGYVMVPLGASDKIYGPSEGMVAKVEMDLENKAKKGHSSKAVAAALVNEYYLIGAIKKMVRELDGVPVDEVFFDLECSLTLGKILQVWINALLVHRPYPKPAWLLKKEGKAAEAAAAEKRGLPMLDPPQSSPSMDGEDGGTSSRPS